MPDRRQHDPSEYLTYREAAALAGVSVRTLMRNVAAQKFPEPFKHNPVSGRTGRLLFRRVLVEEWVRVFRGPR